MLLVRSTLLHCSSALSTPSVCSPQLQLSEVSTTASSLQATMLFFPGEWHHVSHIWTCHQETIPDDGKSSAKFVSVHAWLHMMCAVDARNASQLDAWCLIQGDLHDCQSFMLEQMIAGLLFTSPLDSKQDYSCSCSPSEQSEIL